MDWRHQLIGPAALRLAGLLLAAGWLAGCATGPEKKSARPDNTLTNVFLPVAGEIVRVDPADRTVVIRYAVYSRRVENLQAFRAGQSVARLRVTGPMRYPFAGADILAGNPRPGDIVKP